jgi:hypothetical protein
LLDAFLDVIDTGNGGQDHSDREEEERAEAPHEGTNVADCGDARWLDRGSDRGRMKSREILKL